MSVSPDDFLSSARHMSAENSEIQTRNCVSRAYYAAYHKALEVFPLNREFAKKSKRGVHQTYLDQLDQEPMGSKARNIGIKLKMLRDRRSKADYNLEAHIKAADAAMQLASAQQVFSMLDTVSDSPKGNENKVTEKDEQPPKPTSDDSGNTCRPTLIRIL